MWFRSTKAFNTHPHRFYLCTPYFKPKHACALKPEVLISWTLEIDYSRAPCLGADQKTRGLWERDCCLYQLFDLCLIKHVLTVWLLTSKSASLVTKQCLMVFGRQTFPVCPGPYGPICVQLKPIMMALFSIPSVLFRLSFLAYLFVRLRYM